MIPNITPEEKEWWDKEMSRVQRMQQGQARRLILKKATSILIPVIMVGACYQVAKKKEPTPHAIKDSIEQVLDDTLQMNQGEIPEHPKSFEEYLDSCRYTPGGKDSSYIDANGHSYRLYRGWMVATCPRGWPTWIIWDRRGYNLTRWGKRRDSL